MRDWSRSLADAAKGPPVQVPARSPMPSRIWEFAMSHNWLRQVGPGKWIWDLDMMGVRG